MRHLFLAALVPVVLLTACERGGETPPADGSTTQAPPARPVPDAPDFDAAAAHALIEKQVAFGPRVPGTAGHAAQLEWMTGFLRERADTVQLLPFEHTPRAGGAPVRMTNVFARFAPETTDRILLVAHWDTRPMADAETDPARRAQPIPGANDGGSGVAVLLQLADVLSSHSPPVGVDILLVDGEDFGPDEMFLGAKHFAANQPPGYAPRYGILVDMVGDANPSFPMEQNSRLYAPDVVRRVWDLAGALGYSSIFLPFDGPQIGDDHVPLNEAGIRTIDIIDFDYGPGNSLWHTLADTPENTSPRGLEAVGTVLLHLVLGGG